MRALVQRVLRAEVASRGDDGWETTGTIGPGLCAFVGVTHGDDEAAAAKLAAKLWGLRIFDDDEGAMNRSVETQGGAILVVSQFTLYGDTSRGRRPGWGAAAPPATAEPLVECVIDELRGLGATVASGRFRTDMRVELVNDGPVTLMLEV